MKPEAGDREGRATSAAPTSAVPESQEEVTAVHSIPAFGDARDWFPRRRLGLFVHWGLYALGGWHEQEQYRARIPRDEYARRIHDFNPVRYDPDEWLDLAEEAGMSYVCFTSKHVDGFCMWDSAHTAYKITNTPYRRDTLAMLAEACRRRGFPLCIYYSIADMHHPSYPHAGRAYELLEPDPGDEPDLERYLAYVEAQVRELCTNYGPVHGFWWDGNVLGHQDPTFNDLIRSLQPQAVINGRGFSPGTLAPMKIGEGDFDTPERASVYDGAIGELPAYDRPTEACQSVGIESWGYRRNEDYYTDAHLVRSIDVVLARGGNYLLNVGPRADGTIPEEARRILRHVGAWYRPVCESFDATTLAPGLVHNRDVLLTRRGSALYVHLCRPPTGTAVILAPLDRLPLSATLLNTAEPVDAQVEVLPDHSLLVNAGRPCLRLCNLPVNRLPATALVIRLEFEEAP